MLKIYYAAFVYVYLNWFRRNLLLKCVSQPEIAKKIYKPPILAFNVAPVSVVPKVLHKAFDRIFNALFLKIKKNVEQNKKR